MRMSRGTCVVALLTAYTLLYMRRGIMRWFIPNLRERRRDERKAKKRRQQRHARKGGSRFSTNPSVAFFLFFTIFMAAQMRTRLHPSARGQRWRRSPPYSSWSFSRPSSSSSSSYTHSTTPKKHTAPVNWHALAAEQAAREPSRESREIGTKKNGLSGFAFTALGIGGLPGVINATKEAWDGLQEYANLTLLNGTRLPWEHTSENEAVHAPPLERSSSIFAALRKGPWMGCSRSDALICTGVYRALKRSSAASVFDVDCGKHVAWLPKVVDKLLGEYRLVRIICAVRGEAEYARAKQGWGARRHIRFVRFNSTEAHPSQFHRADVTLARETLHSNLIQAMRFLKTLKAASNSRYLIHDNFPRERINVPTTSGLRMNAALPPFSMPPPFYTHSDPDDVFGVQVTCRLVAEIFETRTTPTMEELVDPRKRRILE